MIGFEDKSQDWSELSIKAQKLQKQRDQLLNEKKYDEAHSKHSELVSINNELSWWFIDKQIADKSDHVITETIKKSSCAETYRVLNSQEEVIAYNTEHNNNNAKLGDTVVIFNIEQFKLN